MSAATTVKEAVSEAPGSAKRPAPAGASGRLRIVEWQFTDASNLRRPLQVAQRVGPPTRDSLSTYEATVLLHDLAASGRPQLVLTGGEPLLRTDLFQLLQVASRLGLKPRVQTNGALLTAATAQRLAEAGTEQVTVTLYGASAEVHDRLAGMNGCFRWSLRALQLLRQAGLGVTLRGEITRLNVAETAPLLQLASDEGCDCFELSVPTPLGECQSRPESVLLSPSHYGQLLRWYVERWVDLDLKRQRLKVEVDCAPLFARLSWERLQRADGLTKEQVEGGMRRLRGCQAGLSSCYVRHDGIIYPCPVLPLQCGDVRRAEMKEIWRRSRILRSMRRTKSLKGRCGRCEFRSLCYGCRARAWIADGDPMGADHFCVQVLGRSASSAASPSERESEAE